MTGDRIHSRLDMCMGKESDIEIAGRVRMLMRTDLNHEAVCTAGRDRICWLIQKLDDVKELIEEAIEFGKESALQDALKRIAE